jgi:DNA-binding PadR family transcriptional regulator
VSETQQSGQHLQRSEPAAIRSPLAWSLLGLVIEHPSYGYELAQRFKQVFGDTLMVGSHKHVYRFLETLRLHSYIEETAPSAKEKPARNRLPKPIYRATSGGRRAYADWLVSQLHLERMRQQMFARQFAMLEPETALELLEAYERECLLEEEDAEAARAEPEPPDEIVGRLEREDERLWTQARLAWLRYARGELRDAIQRRIKRS